MTLHKIPLIKRSKVRYTKKEDDQHTIEAENLRVDIYPESIAQIQRLLRLNDTFKHDHRLVIENKMMKQV